MIDKRPTIIARCATTPDVVRAVTFARDNRLLLAATLEDGLFDVVLASVHELPSP